MVVASDRTLKATGAAHAALLRQLTFDYRAKNFSRSALIHADCFDWLSRLPENSLHAIVTDPPYGVKEYDLEQIEKRSNGVGGVWRIPPSFDGHTAQALVRCTAGRKRAGRG